MNTPLSALKHHRMILIHSTACT